MSSEALATCKPLLQVAGMSGPPGDWRQVALGRIVRIVTDGISAVDLAALPEVHHYSLPAFDEGAGPEVGPGDTIKSNKTVVPHDCVLFSKLNPRIPRIWRVHGDAPPHSYCSTEFWPLVAQGSGVDLDYLTQYLSSADFLGHPDITPASSTNSHQRVDRKAFERFEFVLPPLDEQQRIAVMLRSVDEAIAANEAVHHQRVLVRQGLNALFLRGLNHSDFKPSIIGEIPSSWAVSTMNDVCHNVGVGIASSATHAYVESGVPLLRNQNIKKGHLDLRDLLFVTDEYDRSYKTKRVRAGDVITMRTGYPGRSAVIPAELDGCQTFTTLISRPNQAVIDPKFLCEWINSDLGMIEVRKRQAGGAQQNLNAGSMEQVPVPLPPLDEQRLIADVFQHFPTDDDELIDNLQITRRLLQADLLSGRVRVPA